MIILTRLGGQPLAVNPDLIERAESTPDTVLTLVDGHKLVIAEGLAEVVELVRTWRATIAAQAYAIAREPDLAGFARRGPIAAATDHDSADDDGDDEMSAHTATQASLARVLRLPPRGE